MSQSPFTPALYIQGPCFNTHVSWFDSGVLDIESTLKCAVQRYWKLWSNILTGLHTFMYLSCYKSNHSNVQQKKKRKCSTTLKLLLSDNVCFWMQHKTEERRIYRPCCVLKHMDYITHTHTHTPAIKLKLLLWWTAVFGRLCYLAFLVACSIGPFPQLWSVQES